jgi:hypothetical protein
MRVPINVCPELRQDFRYSGQDSKPKNGQAKKWHRLDPFSGRSKLNSIKTWPQRMADWLADNGFLSAASAGGISHQ